MASNDPNDSKDQPEPSEFSSGLAPQRVSMQEAFWTWCRVALLSFGGPAGQIAVMHRIIVDEKKWISEERFLHALNYCMLLPGPEAQQLATYIGWLMHRTAGGLMAGGLFILPGFVSILILSILYAEFQHTFLLQAVFLGVKPAVIAVVIEAVIRIGKRVLKTRAMIILAACSFAATFFWSVPFPFVVFVAAFSGLIGGYLLPSQFVSLKRHGSSTTPTPTNQISDATTSPSWTRAALVSAICLTLWFGPTLLVGRIHGRNSVFFQEGMFFSKAAMITFGGAYSALAYTAQKAVSQYGWLQPGEMLDGLGMAETTPGPLIMVVQFVGFLAAYRNPGPYSPLVAGLVGSILTTWVTFVPCFYWIFLGAPYIERLRNVVWLNAALSAITAAVVGVVLNLAVWFSLHTLFAQSVERHVLGMVIPVPIFASFHISAGVLTAIAICLMFVWKRGMLVTLAVCTILGVLLHSWAANAMGV